MNSLTTWPLLSLLHFTGAERVTMDTTTWLYAAAVIGCIFGKCYYGYNHVALGRCCDRLYIWWVSLMKLCPMSISSITGVGAPTPIWVMAWKDFQCFKGTSDGKIYRKFVSVFWTDAMALADLGGGVRDARPPLGVQILSISCSFRENLACSRPPWRVHAPPRENPGSATGWGEVIGECVRNSWGFRISQSGGVSWTCSGNIKIFIHSEWLEKLKKKAKHQAQ